MLTSEHLKTLQHVSILFRSSSGSSYFHTERTYTHQMLFCRITMLTFTFLTNFNISNFNKEHRAPWRWSEWDRNM